MQVQLVVRAGQGEASKWQQRHDSVVSTSASSTWPIELSLLPKNEVARVRAISGFVPHRALTLSLRFDDACIAKVDACDATETCRAGKCVDAQVKASLLPSYDPGAHSLIDGKLDAGVGSERDGGITQHSDASTMPGEDASTSSIDGGDHGDAGRGVGDADASMQADSSTAPAPGDFSFVPSNVDLSTVDFDTAPTTTLDCGDATIDTSGSITITGWCGDVPVPKIRTQTGGPELVVLALNGLTVSAGTTLTLTGSRPIAFLVRGDVKVHGTIDANAKGTTPGPGGSLSADCGSGTGGDGASGGATFGISGGGGGGFGRIVIKQ